ncbi:MAG: histidine kinase [Pseudomonadota bacterium]
MLTRFLQEGQWWRASPAKQYWLFQTIGWSALAMLTYLSLTLWYNPGQWTPAAHTVLQSVLGLMVSHPLRWVAQTQWSAPLSRRMMLIALAVIVAALVWTALRLTTFTWLTGERVDAADWGGWFNASVIVYGSWSFCYHALKYYRQWLEEHERLLKAEKAALAASAKAQEETLKRLETESLFRESQLRMLKYQLNPHFLFNALNSVTAMVRKHDSAKAIEMLGRVGDFLRTSLEQDDALQHPLRDELAVSELYLSIEKARFGDRLLTDFEASEEALDVPVPSFILQPLFENALKYAVGQSLEPTTVRLLAWIDEGWLEIRLSDTGAAGHEPSYDKKASTGIGLQNVEARLKSSYGQDYRFALEQNKPRGACVSLAFKASVPTPPLRTPEIAE